MKKLLVRILKMILGRLDNHCREFFAYVDSGVVTKEYQEYGYKFFTQIVFCMSPSRIIQAATFNESLMSMPKMKMPSAAHELDALAYLSTAGEVSDKEFYSRLTDQKATIETQFNKAIREKDQMDRGKKLEQERMRDFANKLSDSIYVGSREGNLLSGIEQEERKYRTKVDEVAREGLGIPALKVIDGGIKKE